MTTTNTYTSKTKTTIKRPAKSVATRAILKNPYAIKGTPPQPSKYRNLQAFFIMNGASTQQFLIDADRPAIIKGKQGLVIFLAAHSFINVAHQPVTGKIIIRIKELFSKSDMVLTDRPSTAQNRLLASGGAFFISATQRNLPLQLVRPAEVILPISEKVSNPSIMQVFRGSRSKSDPFTDKPRFDWKKSEKSSIKIGVYKKTKMFKLTLNELNWINCDHFFRSDVASSMFTVQTSGVKEPLKEQATFLVFKNINAVARLFRKGHKFSMYNIPNQEALTIVSIGIDEQQQLYFGKEEVEASSKQIVPLQLRPIEEELLLKICQGLD